IQDGVVTDTVRYLDSMERDVAALSALVDDVFLLARLDSGSYELERVNVDVAEVVDEAIDALKPLAAEHNVSLILEATEPVFATASPDAVGRVVRNLIDNAIRHAPAGSSIVVSVTGGRDTVRVHVVDEGVGFDADFIPVAFQRFTRGDDARTRETGGSGLGLAIAGELVSALRGRIWADPGPGGRVNVELPATVL
ncbi:MAG: sensor histidine kinase, partial [Acidimicrobiia bacterium]